MPKHERKKKQSQEMPPFAGATGAINSFLTPGEGRQLIEKKFTELVQGDRKLEKKSIHSIVGLLSISPRIELTITKNSIAIKAPEATGAKGALTDAQRAAYAEQVVALYLAGHGIDNPAKCPSNMTQIKAEVFGTPKMRQAIYKAFLKAGVAKENLTFAAPEQKGKGVKSAPGIDLDLPSTGKRSESTSKDQASAHFRRTSGQTPSDQASVHLRRRVNTRNVSQQMRDHLSSSQPGQNPGEGTPSQDSSSSPSQQQTTTAGIRIRPPTGGGTTEPRSSSSEGSSQSDSSYTGVGVKPAGSSH